MKIHNQTNYLKIIEIIKKSEVYYKKFEVMLYMHNFTIPGLTLC